MWPGTHTLKCELRQTLVRAGLPLEFTLSVLPEFLPEVSGALRPGGRACMFLAGRWWAGGFGKGWGAEAEDWWKRWLHRGKPGGGRAELGARGEGGCGTAHGSVNSDRTTH